MRKDRFTDEALRNAYALAELKYSENEEDQVAFEEAYDFARCQRPDGSFYGTSGQCRKGTKTGDKVAEPKQPRAPKAAAAPAAPKPTGFGGESVQQLKSEADAAWKRAREIGKKEAAAVAELRRDPQNKDLLRKVQVVQRERMNEDDRYRILTKKAKKLEREQAKGGGGPGRTADQLTPKEQAARGERQKAGEANRQAQAGAAAAAKAATKTAARRGESPEMKAKDNELRTQIKDKMGQQKERKAELDRIERAFKMQEKAVKAEPTKENKERLKRVRTALIQQERSYNRGERELEKMGKERMRLQQKMERAKMSPAQRAEDRRIRAIIRERG